MGAIVCATGLYSRFPLPYFANRTPDEIAESFVKEATEGIGQTGVRAGIIKCATGHGQVTEYEEKVLRAVGRAHRQTGVPIITHTEEGTMGPEQAAIFESEGVDLSRVIIGHSNDNTDLRYHLSILEKGANLGFDRFGFQMHTPDRLQIGSLVGLLSMGFERQIVLSQDAFCSGVGRRGAPRPPEVLKLLENWNYTHLAKHIIPRLKECGVTQEQIDTMTIENPARILGGG